MFLKKTSSSHWFGRTTVAFLILVITLVNPTFAQVVGGTLSGTISDPSGAGIPQAKVAIKNTATSVERIVTTNSDGFYTTPNLLPGTYQVTVSANGFSTETSHGLTITVGSPVTFDVILHVGTVSNRIEVTAQVPDVQFTSSDIGAVVESNTVREQ